jgi:phosphatidylinositol alpha-1,6-mannosyltransferase
LIRSPAPEVAVPSAEQVNAVRAQLGLSNEQSVFVYPGDLEFSRGAHVVAEAVAPLTAKLPNAVVVFACRRKTQRAVIVEAELAQRLPRDKVRFAGELPSLLPLLAAAQCVLFPVEDMWAKVDIPIAVLEAMRLSVPVIVPDRGPLSELVGPLVLNASGPSFAAAAARVACDMELRAEVVANQQRTVRSEFDARSVARRYEAVYDSICQ